jgi:hypothetical protein
MSPKPPTPAELKAWEAQLRKDHEPTRRTTRLLLTALEDQRTALIAEVEKLYKKQWKMRGKSAMYMKGFDTALQDVLDVLKLLEKEEK